MKKGTKIRIKRSRKIGVVADSRFITLSGKREVRHLVKSEESTRWYTPEELGSVVERCQVEFRNDDNEAVKLNISFDHTKSDNNMCIDISLGGRHVIDQKDELYFTMMHLFIKSLSD